MNGIVKSILLAKDAGGAIISVQSAELQAGKGIVGDRYYSSQGTFSEILQDLPEFELTLIEQEQIDYFNQLTGFHYSGIDFRRNIVTTGIRLNDLVDKEFSIGKVKLRGIRLCEPCAHLASISGPKVLQHMVHRAGLRTQILSGGDVHISDIIIR